MNCKYCNAEIAENSKFCNECGQSMFDSPKMGANKPRGKTVAIALGIAAFIVVFVILFVVFGYFGKLENKLEGSWSRYDMTSQTNDQILYSFTSNGGTYIKNPEASIITDGNNDEFEWFITDEDSLIILWENGSYRKYIWNPDYANYHLTPESSFWFLDGDRLYLSNIASETGYYEYNEYIGK